MIDELLWTFNEAMLDPSESRSEEETLSLGSDLRLFCQGGDALELADDRDGGGGVQVVFRQLHLCNSCSQDAVRIGRAVRMQSGMQSGHFSTCVIRAVRMQSG